MLRELLEPLAELDGVAEVRSAGLAGAVELDAEPARGEHPARRRGSGRRGAHADGVITRALRGVALQISPPLVVTEDELAAIVEGIAAAAHETVSTLGA